MGVVAEDFFKIDQRCRHCEEPCPRAQDFCKHCKTRQQRDEMDAENTEIFATAGLTFNPPKI